MVRFRQRSVPWLPSYRISRTVSRVRSRCRPMFQLWTYPIFRSGENSFTLLPERWPPAETRIRGSGLGRQGVPEENAAGSAEIGGAMDIEAQRAALIAGRHRERRRVFPDY